MSRVTAFLILLLLLAAQTSQAIQLHWSSGASDLTFTSAARCVLVVQADSAEVRLPSEWTLQWLADSSGVNLVAVDSLAACQADTAKASAIDPPSTPADSAAHLITAHFCSAGGSATTAYFVLDQPGGSAGRLKVVAIDPMDPDSSRIIESGEVTYNGGVDGTYQPAILRVTSTHHSEELEVTAIGSGLSSIQSMSLGAADGLWTVPLQMVAKSKEVVTASAMVATLLPASTLSVVTSQGSVAVGSLAADQEDVVDQVAVDTILVRDPSPATYYPKDFAFTYNVVPSGDPQHPWQGLFHLMYIRARHDNMDSCLVHATSTDLRTWSFDKRAFVIDPTPSAWDHLHVWAPSIVQLANVYYMFYTGVDNSNNQRIGYVYTTQFAQAALDSTWHRNTSWVYSAANTRWADPSGYGNGGAQQFRDPWVMPDPDNAGRYLMFNIGEDVNYTPPHTNPQAYNVVGVASNGPGTFGSWNDLGSYRKTDWDFNGGFTDDESPLVMRDSSAAGSWRIFVANGFYNPSGSNSTFFITGMPGASVSDTTGDTWPAYDLLYSYLGDDASLLGWDACEHVQVGKAHYFAAYNGDGIGITRMYWDSLTNNFVIGYPTLTGVGGGDLLKGVRFYLADYHPGHIPVRFVLESATVVSPRLSLYDVSGRKIRVLGEPIPGHGKREYIWDGRDSQGRGVSAGVYFARMIGVGGPRVLRVVVLK